MALGNNGTLRTNSVLRDIVNNNLADIIVGTDAAEAFSFTDLNGGLSGDDTIRQFGKNDVLLNYRSIYDGNADNLIDLGSNGLLDIDRTGAGAKRAGPDQIRLEGLGGGALRYLGDKQGYSVYADASVRLKGLTEGSVNNDSFDAARGGKAYSFFYDTALGLNLGGDTIRNFGADDRIVTTTRFFDGGNANGAIGTGANGVFDLSGTSVSTKGDDGVANGGQIDIVGVSALYLLSTTSVNGVTYYSYGSTPNTPLPPANRAPTAPATTSVTLDEDSATAATVIGASDADGDALTYAIKAGSAPAKGTVVFDQQAGTFFYTPDADKNGADTFTIVISDGKGGNTEQRVTANITPIQDVIAPIDLNDVAAGKGGLKISGQAEHDQAGTSVSSAGDINGDGIADLIVGAVNNNANDYNSGAAYVVFGRKNGAPIDLNTVAAGVGGFKISGQTAYSHTGYSVSGAGDVNGDGLADVIVGAFGNDENDDESGAAYVVFGKTSTAAVDVNAIANGIGGFKISGQVASDYAGYSVSGAGDINGDGLADLIVGAYGRTPNGSNSGAAYVVFGKKDGAAIDLNAVANGTGGFGIDGQASGDGAGYSVSNAGDVNGDGLNDLIVAAVSNDANGSDSGGAYVVFGKTDTGTIDLNAIADGVGGFKISGPSAGEYAGGSVSSAGDVNGDGLTDLIIGSYNDGSNGASSGAAYVVFGKTNGSLVDLNAVTDGIGGFKIIGQAQYDGAGYSVSSAGDVNRDGLDDLIVGAIGSNASGEDNGAAYLVFGKKDGGAIDLNAVAVGVGGLKISGQATFDYAGRSASSAGDFNGDGFIDLIVGAIYNDANGQDSGAAYVIYGSSDWLI